MAKKNQINTNSEMTEFEQLNARTDERIAEETANAEEQERIARQMAEEERKAFAKAEKEKQRRKAYSNKSAVSVLALLMLSGAVTVAGMAEMIHPTIWVATSVICLCAACIRFGAWFGRVAK